MTEVGGRDVVQLLMSGESQLVSGCLQEEDAAAHVPLHTTVQANLSF